MAKPKQKYLVEVYHGTWIHVHCDNPEITKHEIEQIEGVEWVDPLNKVLSVWVDPRYDAQEVAQEIRELLSSEVPEVFNE